MGKYAVIDIGTNSIRLLLATIKENNGNCISGQSFLTGTQQGQPFPCCDFPTTQKNRPPVFLERRKYINTTRIGASIDKNKTINKEGIEKNIEVFCDFVQKAREHGAEEILAIATSAVREAKNRDEFIQAIYQKTGVNIKIISGEEEAELGYKGVIMGLKYHSETDSGDNLRHSGTGSSCVMHPNDTKGPAPCVRSPVAENSFSADIISYPCAPVIVIDIGGGSTELILGTKNGNIIKTISLDIGAVRMTEKFIITDPVDKEEYEKMKTAIYKTIKNHAENSFSASSASLTAVGIGGTITTLAALHQKLDPYDPEKTHNYKLTSEDINNLKEKLLSLTVQQIKQLKGIHPKRADIIIAGITILSVIMDSLNLREITVSEYDNLEGMLYNEM